jgi:hypothetical protein
MIGNYTLKVTQNAQVSQPVLNAFVNSRLRPADGFPGGNTWHSHARNTVCDASAVSTVRRTYQVYWNVCCKLGACGFEKFVGTRERKQKVVLNDRQEVGLLATGPRQREVAGWRRKRGKEKGEKSSSRKHGTQIITLVGPRNRDAWQVTTSRTGPMGSPDGIILSLAC